MKNNNLCDLCQESNDKTNVIQLTDKNSRVEIRGCKKCIDELYKDIKNVKDRAKMTNKALLTLLKLNIDNFMHKKLTS